MATYEIISWGVSKSVWWLSISSYYYKEKDWTYESSHTSFSMWRRDGVYLQKDPH